MRHFSFLSVCLLLQVLTSCTSINVADAIINSPEDNSIQSLLIEKGPSQITAEQAINVAKIFDMRTTPKTKASNSRKVLNVQDVCDNDGHPVMYIVEYQKNQGFTIVSASRKFQPILAEEIKGSFSERRNSSGVNILIQELTELINFAESLPETDETIKRYINEWKDYEKHDVSDASTKSDDLLTLRANSIAAWEAQGYTCYDLSDCPNSLPQSVYADWLDLAEQVANPDYNYYTNSIILYLREDTVAQNGPLLQTTWGQDEPYNVYTQVINGVNARAGCSVVAMGQIMKYYCWPTVYPWSSMNNQYGFFSSAPEVATLFYDLGQDFHTHYQSGSSTSTDTLMMAITGSQYAYHYNATYGTHNYNTAVSEVVSNRPVFMEGVDLSDGTAHAWVCDGYKINTTHRKYMLKVLSVDEPLSYVSAGSPYESYDSSSYMHMNWGEDGAANGWFYQDYVFYSGPFLNTTVTFNYSSQRKDVTGISPNYN